MVAVKFDSAGSVDLKFGVSGDGAVKIDVAGGEDGVTDAAVAPDGGLLLAGYACHHSVDRGDCDIAVVKLTPDGSFAEAFGDNGLVLLDFDRGGFESAEAIVANESGGVLIAARSGDLGLVIALTSDGTLDTGFADSGVAEVWADSWPVDIGIHEGLVLAVGDDGEAVKIVRLLPDGSADWRFGENGFVDETWPEACRTKNPIFMLPRVFAAVAIDESGSIIVGFDRCLAAFTPNGHLDSRFGSAPEAGGP
jgi:uncharacterized delta-60 repeat protein